MNLNFSKNSNFSVPNQLKPASSSLVEATLLIIVCALVAWFLILPKRAEIAQKKLDLAAAQLEESQIASKLAKLQELVKSLEAHDKEVGYLDQALPLDGKALRLRFLIEDMAKSVGVTIGDVNVATKGDLVAGDKTLLADPYGAARTLQKLTTSIYVTGTFSQLQVFLRNIENSGRLMEINDMSIDPGTDGELNLKLSLSAYYMAP